MDKVGLKDKRITKSSFLSKVSSAKPKQEGNGDTLSHIMEFHRTELPKIQNIVATVNLQCPLNLKTIALYARNAEYNPRRFSAVIMRLRNPKTTALIFASGKMVCTGAKNEKACRIASRKFARVVQKLSFPVQFTAFKIQNIVANCNVNFPIDLEHILNAHNDYCSYEPEIFPGLVYRMLDPKVVLLVFVSGKLVLTGAKTQADINLAFQKIFPVLVNARKKKIANL